MEKYLKGIVKVKPSLLRARVLVLILALVPSAAMVFTHDGAFCLPLSNAFLTIRSIISALFKCFYHLAERVILYLMASNLPTGKITPNKTNTFYLRTKSGDASFLLPLPGVLHAFIIQFICFSFFQTKENISQSAFKLGPVIGSP